MEVGMVNINFLDLNMKTIGGTHRCKFFRKPTYKDTIILADSNPPINHKHAAFHSMIYRFVTIFTFTARRLSHK